MHVIVLRRYTKLEVRRPSRSEDMADFFVTALIGPVTLTFDLSTSKWDHGPTVSWASFLPIFSFLCPFVSHGTDRQTDRQRPSVHVPTLWERGYNNKHR